MADDQSETPPATPERRSYALSSLALLVAVLLANAYFRASLLDVPLERDEGEYAYGGQRLLAGESPYSALYSMKFPGIYVIFALIEAAFGQSIRAIHLGLLIATTVSIVLVFLLGRWWRGPLIGAVAAGCFAALEISPGLGGIAAQSEQFLLPFVLAAVLLLIAGLEHGRFYWFFAAGVCAATAVTVKQHAIVFVVMDLAILLASRFREQGGTWRRTLARIAMFALGGLVPPAIMIALLAWSADLQAFWYWTVEYAARYATAVTLADGWKNFVSSTSRIFWAAPQIWVLAAWGLIVVWREPSSSQRKTLFWLLALFSALGVCPGLYFRPHYFILILPVAALAAAAGIESVAHWIGFGRPQRARVALVVLAWFVPLISLIGPGWLLARLSSDRAALAVYGLNPFSASVEVGDYLRRHTEPDAKIAVVGSEPQIYFYAHRPAATRYVYMYELMQPHERAEEMQREMIAEIEAARPEYLVYAAFPLSWLARENSPRLVHSWFAKYATEHYDQVGIVEAFAEAPVEAHWGQAVAEYRPKTANWFSIWRRRHQDGTSAQGN